MNILKQQLETKYILDVIYYTDLKDEQKQFLIEFLSGTKLIFDQKIADFSNISSAYSNIVKFEENYKTNIYPGVLKSIEASNLNDDIKEKFKIQCLESNSKFNAWHINQYFSKENMSIEQQKYILNNSFLGQSYTNLSFDDLLNLINDVNNLKTSENNKNLLLDVIEFSIFYQETLFRLTDKQKESLDLALVNNDQEKYQLSIKSKKDMQQQAQEMIEHIKEQLLNNINLPEGVEKDKIPVVFMQEPSYKIILNDIVPEDVQIFKEMIIVDYNRLISEEQRLSLKNKKETTLIPQECKDVMNKFMQAIKENKNLPTKNELTKDELRWLKAYLLGINFDPFVKNYLNLSYGLNFDTLKQSILLQKLQSNYGNVDFLKSLNDSAKLTGVLPVSNIRDGYDVQLARKQELMKDNDISDLTQAQDILSKIAKNRDNSISINKKLKK